MGKDAVKAKSNKLLTKIENICPYAEQMNSPVCPRINKVDDEPTKFASLGFRCFLTILGWCLLAQSMGIDRGTFVSQIMWCIPLLKDYMEYKPKDRLRRFICRVGFVISLICILCASLGLFGFIHAQLIDDMAYIILDGGSLFSGVFHLKALYIWLFMGILIICTLVDWIISETPQETVHTSQNMTV